MRLKEVQSSKFNLSESKQWLKKLLLLLTAVLPEVKFKKTVDNGEKIEYEADHKNLVVDMTELGSSNLNIRHLTVRIALDTDEGPIGYPIYDVNFNVTHEGGIDTANNSWPAQTIQTALVNRLKAALPGKWVEIYSHPMIGDISITPEEFAERA